MKSKFLESNRKNAKDLVSRLKEHFKYVSILGTDVKNTGIRVLKSTTDSFESMSNERGFVVKLSNNDAIFEYAFDNFDCDINTLVEKILAEAKLDDELGEKVILSHDYEEETMIKSYNREDDYDKYPNEVLLTELNKIKDELLSRSEIILNGGVIFQKLEINKLFISPNKELDQHYTWSNGTLYVVYQDNDKVVSARENTYSPTIREILNELPKKIDKLIDKASHLTTAKPIEPGVYDIITDASISGLIAHEAFGHGVEMDQFVKDRALAKKYVGEYVASPITNMRDGAASCLSTASYFFDDDGVLAHDTKIIDNGILVRGLCDLTSARELNTEPTGNSRRENFSHKAYTRMTNTFFEKGTDKLEDMIKSIKHGYFLFETNNGMEDPKNWAIQCTAEYGIEIIDGKLTDNYVAPVVMSGYVPDLLKSITMISDEFHVEGAGSCGKGYKEWVRVSTGGPNLKARVKLS